MYRYSILLLLCLIGFTSIAQSDDPKIVEIITVDGAVIKGEILEETTDKVILQSQTLGRIELLRKDIKSLNYTNTEISGIPIDYHGSTRYLVSPNGYLLKKGQSYYENIGVFFNSYAVGITDNFNVAVGGEIASLLFGEQFPIIYVSPKFGLPFKNDSGSWSIGTTFFSSPSNDFEGFGFLNTSVTLGNRNSNFSIGTGLGYSFSDGIAEGIIPVLAGGNWRLSKKISLVTDNFIIFSSDGFDTFAVLSAGVKIHFDSGASFNAALWRPTEGIGDLIALPFVSVTIPLSK